MQGQEEKERDDDEQQKKQVRRADIDPGRIGGDRSVEEVQEIVEVIDSSAANCVWPVQKNGVVRSKSKKEVKLAAASGSAIRVEGDAKLEFMREGEQCCMKFWDADVKRSLASVSAIVDGGSKVVFGQQESYIENESTVKGFSWFS